MTQERKKKVHVEEKKRKTELDLRIGSVRCVRDVIILSEILGRPLSERENGFF